MFRARILVVEDESIVAADLRSTLEVRGYEVCAVVGTGEDAVSAARSYAPNLALVDVFLQGSVDGISAARIIQEELDVPVIYLTAYFDEDLLKRARTTKPFGYLTKPFRDIELYGTIETALFKHQTDQELKRNQYWLSVILNSIGDAVIASDEHGRIAFMNPLAETLTGWSHQEAAGMRLEDALRLEEATAEAVSSVSPDRLILCLLGSTRDRFRLLVSRHGQRRLVEATATPLRDLDSKSLGHVVVFRDVTDQCISQEWLNLLSQAVQQSSEGIAVTTLDQTLLFVNKAFAEMHGWAQESLSGKHIAVLHTPAQAEEVEAAQQELLLTGSSSRELWHTRTDGSSFLGLVNSSVLRDDRGTPVAIISALRDITSIRRAEQELRSSHEALEAYSSSLEAKVEERTRALEASKLELEKYSESLEKTNEALRMVIESIDDQKREAEKKITNDINLTIKPIIDQLKSQTASDTVSFLVQSLEFGLSNLFSSFDFDPITSDHRLTPREVRICEMIRSGLSSKQIAKIMGISSQTVLVHRKNIRKKLNLGGSGQNLASFLKARKMT
ncbi:MAG: PAS domain S-box protein [Thermodesulfobacteriota bacterium]